MRLITQIKKWFIPKGFYCYKPLKIITDEKFGFRMRTKSCPFFQHFWGIDGYCNLLDDVVIDQCKICNINEFTEKDLDKMEKKATRKA